MVQRIGLLKEKLIFFNVALTDKQKDLIFVGSIKNFLLYIDKFPTVSEKESVVEKIEYYFQQLEEQHFEFNVSKKKDILKNVIHPIAFYYIARFHFKYHSRLKTMLFTGFNIDVFLWIIGLLSSVYYVPIASILFALYWLYIELFYAKKNRVY